MLIAADTSVDSARSFAYRAALADGSIESGTVTAPTLDAAAQVIAGRGQWVVEVRPVRMAAIVGRRLSSADLALGLRLLASLLDAALPLSRALAAWEDVAPDAWQPALPLIRDAINRGESLATALATAPVTIPPVVVGIIRAGEAGSALAPAVQRAAALTEATAATRAAIRAALAYPLILAIAGSGSIVLLVGVVLPRFATILTDLGQTLPTTTRTVLAFAAAVRADGLPGAVVASAIGLLWYQWHASKSGRLAWDRALLSVPVVGSIRRARGTARYTRALGALLQSGVPIDTALRFATDTVDDEAIADALRLAREKVLRGERLSASLTSTDALTVTTLKIIRAGEESGHLSDMLDRAASLEQDNADRAVKAAVRLLEPTLILLFGGLVAFVAAALLQAVYSVRPGG